MHGFSVSSWISAISAESSWKSANSSWKSANRSLCYLIIMSPQWCMHSSKILHVLWANSSWKSANSSWKSANSSWKSANSSWAQKPENRKAQIKRPTPIVIDTINIVRGAPQIIQVSFAAAWMLLFFRNTLSQSGP